jgi:hypothetical protein
LDFLLLIWFDAINMYLLRGIGLGGGTIVSSPKGCSRTTLMMISFSVSLIGGRTSAQNDPRVRRALLSAESVGTLQQKKKKMSERVCGRVNEWVSERKRGLNEHVEDERYIITHSDWVQNNSNKELNSSKSSHSVMILKFNAAVPFNQWLIMCFHALLPFVIGYSIVNVIEEPQCARQTVASEWKFSSAYPGLHQEKMKINK